MKLHELNKKIVTIGSHRNRPEGFPDWNITGQLWCDDDENMEDLETMWTVGVMYGMESADISFYGKNVREVHPGYYAIIELEGI